MSERRIEYRRIQDVQPATLNPKLHHDSLRTSIDVQGYVDPIVEDSRTGRLVSGHGRLDELLRRHGKGEAAPDGIRVEGEDWLVPVVVGWASKDDAHATSYLLAANRIPEAGGWREDEVAALLAALEEVDPSLVVGSGFDEQAINEVLSTADDERVQTLDDGDDWKQIVLRLPPDVASMFEAALDAMGGPQSEAVRRLVESATGEPPPPF